MFNKQINLNQIVRLDPDGASPIILTGGNGLTAFNHPHNRDSFPDDDLGNQSKHESAGAFDFLNGELVFNAREDDWLYDTFESYWRDRLLVRIDQLKDQTADVSATNKRLKFQGMIFSIPDSGQWNTMTSVTLPYRIFQSAYSIDDAVFTDRSTGAPVVWET